MVEEINHPSRYTGKTGMQALDVIEEFGLDFWRGNAFKYIVRCLDKGGEENINKAIEYLEDYKRRKFGVRAPGTTQIRYGEELKRFRSKKFKWVDSETNKYAFAITPGGFIIWTSNPKKARDFSWEYLEKHLHGGRIPSGVLIANTI